MLKVCFYNIHIRHISIVNFMSMGFAFPSYHMPFSPTSLVPMLLEIKGKM